MTTVVLLPGMDGTGTLLEPLAAAAPEGIATHIVRYPPDRVLTFDEYVDVAASQLPEGDFAMVAESFSGPIGVRFAHRATKLMLCNTFVTPPWPPALAVAVAAVVVVAARLRREAMAAVDRKVLASRIRIALRVDVREDLAKTTVPLLDLRGTRDWVVHRRHRRTILQARPDARTADVEGPHALLLARPHEVWMAIVSFLQE